MKFTFKLSIAISVVTITSILMTLPITSSQICAMDDPEIREGCDEVLCGNFTLKKPDCRWHMMDPPVCATFLECPKDSCTKTFANECFACANPNVSSFEYGRCKDEIFTCDPRPSNCPKYIERLGFDPVCVNTSQGSLTYETSCQACLDPLVTTYRAGPCTTSIDGRHYCDPSKYYDDVDEVEDLVCAFYRADCPQEFCSVTVKNPSYACFSSIPQVVYWTPGPCKNESDRRILCTTDDRLDSCKVPDKPSQVCAIENACIDQCATQISCRRSCGPTYPDKFAACHENGIFAYQPGPCRIPCDDHNYDIEICASESLDPVCGVNNKGRTETFENQCTACSKSTAVEFSWGPCEINASISCTNQPPPSCIFGLVEPVCGFLGNEGDSTTIRKSFENSCSACNNSQVKTYQAELCPQDKGVLCDPDNRPTNCPNTYDRDRVYRDYDYVCGTTFDGDDAVFESSCLACANTSIAFFNTGTCNLIQSCEQNTLPNITEDSSVCVFIPKCGQDVCSQRRSDLQSVCREVPGAFFAMGRCEDLTIYCARSPSSFLTDDCEDINFVCAFYKEECPEEICSNTVKNSCLACQDQDVLYWKPGKCEKESLGKILVDLHNRPENCTDDDNHNQTPVCAFQQAGEITGNACLASNKCGVTMDSACQARQNTSVLSYYPGPCTLLCKFRSFAETCQDDIIVPVCGLHEDDCQGDNCAQSYLNPCKACNQTGVVKFSLGLCLGDEGIACPEERSSCPDNDEAYVCDFMEGDEFNCDIGVFCGRIGKSEECASDITNVECWKDFSTPCLACFGGSMVYKSGSCGQNKLL